MDTRTCYNCIYSYRDPRWALSVFATGFSVRPARANRPDSLCSVTSTSRNVQVPSSCFAPAKFVGVTVRVHRPASLSGLLGTHPAVTCGSSAEWLERIHVEKCTGRDSPRCPPHDAAWQQPRGCLLRGRGPGGISPAPPGSGDAVRAADRGVLPDDEPCSPDRHAGARRFAGGGSCDSTKRKGWCSRCVLRYEPFDMRTASSEGGNAG